MTANPTSSPSAIELFAGGGGLALGLGQAGFDHLALVEWWAPAARVLRHNADSGTGLWTADSVHEVDVRQAAPCLQGLKPDLIAGGPPCQPFSLAGVHAGDNDARNMFPAALDLVRTHRPALVIFENVPGLTRPGFAPYLDYVKAQLRRPAIDRKNDDELWNEHNRRILNSTTGEEYRVYQHEIDAADLGVPQNRRRVFIIAIRADQPGADTWNGIDLTHSRDNLWHEQYVTGDYWTRHHLTKRNPPKRTAAQINRIRMVGPDPERKPWVTLRDLLRNVPPPGETAPEEWPNHIYIPGARTYAKHTGSPIDLPSKTIKAGVHGVSGGEAMIRHLNGAVRYLTVREAALAQGFPQNYEFPGYRSSVMGVIGNAVAVHVAATLGRALLTHAPPRPLTLSPRLPPRNPHTSGSGPAPIPSRTGAGPPNERHRPMHTQISVKDLTDEDIYRTLRTCIDSIGGALRPDFDGITVTDAYVDEDISGIEIVLTDEAGVELHAILQLTGRWIEALMSTTTINTLLADSIEPLRGISPGVAYYLRGSKR